MEHKSGILQKLDIVTEGRTEYIVDWICRDQAKQDEEQGVAEAEQHFPNGIVSKRFSVPCHVLPSFKTARNRYAS
jgi:hypothetical protein